MDREAGEDLGEDAGLCVAAPDERRRRAHPKEESPPWLRSDLGTGR